VNTGNNSQIKIQSPLFQIWERGLCVKANGNFLSLLFYQKLQHVINTTVSGHIRL